MDRPPIVWKLEHLPTREYTRTPRVLCGRDVNNVDQQSKSSKKSSKKEKTVANPKSDASSAATKITDESQKSGQSGKQKAESKSDKNTKTKTPAGAAIKAKKSDSFLAKITKVAKKFRPQRRPPNINFEAETVPGVVEKNFDFVESCMGMVAVCGLFSVFLFLLEKSLYEGGCASFIISSSCFLTTIPASVIFYRVSPEGGVMFFAMALIYCAIVEVSAVCAVWFGDPKVTDEQVSCANMVSGFVILQFITAILVLWKPYQPVGKKRIFEILKRAVQEKVKGKKKGCCPAKNSTTDSVVMSTVASDKSGPSAYKHSVFSSISGTSTMPSDTLAPENMAQRYETQTIPSQHSSDFRNGSDSSLPHVVINDFADVETNYDVNNNSFGNNRIASDAGSFVIQDAGHTPVLMNRMQPFDRSNHSGVRLNFSDTSQNNYFGQREPEMQESVYADRNLNR